MSLDALRETLPAYAKDLSLNLSSLAAETTLTDQQKWGAFLASAHAVGVAPVVQAVEASAVLSPEAASAAKAAAAIMGMNNIYYRFLHLVEDPEYAQMPARLRMNVIGNPGIDKLEFELLSLAVSAVNGCGMCVTTHERKLREGGISREAIQSAVRIASVMHAVAGVLEYQAAA
jgi:alkyl hydroperoxide reductase subunit D